MGHYDCKSCYASPWQEHSVDCERFGPRSIGRNEMTEITQADLKPCPFCGGEACSEKYWPTWDTREARVWCYSECGAEVVRKTEAEAIAV